MNLIWSMGDGGAQQVVLNYLRDFRDDPEIDFWLYVYTEPTRSKYDREIAEQGYNVVYLNNPLTKIQIPYIRRFFQRVKFFVDCFCFVNADDFQIDVYILVSRPATAGFV